jgi:excisionase family DNA binding protein
VTEQTTPLIRPRTRNTLPGYEALANYPAALTIGELAGLLRCSEATISRACERGSIQAIRLGRMVRIGKPEVRRLLREGTR